MKIVPKLLKRLPPVIKASLQFSSTPNLSTILIEQRTEQWKAVGKYSPTPLPISPVPMHLREWGILTWFNESLVKNCTRTLSKSSVPISPVPMFDAFSRIKKLSGDSMVKKKCTPRKLVHGSLGTEQLSKKIKSMVQPEFLKLTCLPLLMLRIEIHSSQDKYFRTKIILIHIPN